MSNELSDEAQALLKSLRNDEEIPVGVTACARLIHKLAERIENLERATTVQAYEANRNAIVDRLCAYGVYRTVAEDLVVPRDVGVPTYKQRHYFTREEPKEGQLILGVVISAMTWDRLCGRDRDRRTITPPLTEQYGIRAIGYVVSDEVDS